MTKAERRELERYRSTTRTLKWAAGLLLSMLVGLYYIAPTLAPLAQPQTTEPSGWTTEVIPEPNTPWVDALLDNIITPAYAARHPVSEEPKLKRYAYDAGKLKLWHITQLSTDTKHEGCVATRELTPVTSISVMTLSKGTITLLIEGVNFGLTEDSGYSDAILNVDNQTKAITSAVWHSNFRTMIDISQVGLQQFANGKTLRVIVNNKYFDFDLAESQRAASAVQSCNSQGQARTTQRRVDAAIPADVR